MPAISCWERRQPASQCACSRKVSPSPACMRSSFEPPTAALSHRRGCCCGPGQRILLVSSSATRREPPYGLCRSKTLVEFELEVPTHDVQARGEELLERLDHLAALQDTLNGALDRLRSAELRLTYAEVTQ